MIKESNNVVSCEICKSSCGHEDDELWIDGRMDPCFQVPIFWPRESGGKVSKQILVSV